MYLQAGPILQSSCTSTLHGRLPETFISCSYIAEGVEIVCADGVAICLLSETAKCAKYRIWLCHNGPNSTQASVHVLESKVTLLSHSLVLHLRTMYLVNASAHRVRFVRSVSPFHCMSLIS